MTAKRAADRYRMANEMCARIITADPAKHPRGSLAATWAALVLQKEVPTIRGPLFDRRAA